MEATELLPSNQRIVSPARLFFLGRCCLVGRCCCFNCCFCSHDLIKVLSSTVQKGSGLTCIPYAAVFYCYSCAPAENTHGNYCSVVSTCYCCAGQLCRACRNTSKPMRDIAILSMAFWQMLKGTDYAVLSGLCCTAMLPVVPANIGIRQVHLL